MNGCKHTTVYVVCESDLSDPAGSRCHWQCISCEARGTEFVGEDAFDLATAEAQIAGRTLS